MIPHLFYYQLVILVLVWLCVMLPHLWPAPSSGLPKRPADPIKPKRNRSIAPKPFAGLTHKPHCALCEQEPVESAPALPVRPAPIPPTGCDRAIPTAEDCELERIRCLARSSLWWNVGSVQQPSFLTSGAPLWFILHLPRSC